MENKTLTPLLLGLLFAAFGLVSLAVIITGSHPYFIKKKLRLGALIISLTGAVTGCLEPMCYDPVAPDQFEIDRQKKRDDTLTVVLPDSNLIRGKIYSPTRQYYSFGLLDNSDAYIQKDTVHAVDGAFDGNIEEFRIAINSNIEPGIYTLRFFPGRPDTTTVTEFSISFKLEVKRAAQ
jgi:hypothetical protein